MRFTFHDTEGARDIDTALLDDSPPPRQSLLSFWLGVALAIGIGIALAYWAFRWWSE